MEQKEFWNNLALDFPRYDDKNDDFQQKVIKILEQNNILSSQSSVLDIGCGTGIYTIPIAKKVKKVLALDISSKMVELLKEDIWFHNLNNIIEVEILDWTNFESSQKFDVVFASLSAAFKSNEDFEKILNYSKSYVCFLDFVDTKGSNFEQLLYEKFGIEEKRYNDLKNIKKWVDIKGIEYNVIPLKNEYFKLLEQDLARYKIKELIKNSETNLNLSNEEIDLMIKPLIFNGKVKHQFDMNLELLYWKN